MAYSELPEERRIMKKVVGTIMIVVGALFALASLSIPKSLSKLGTIVAKNGWTSYAYGYLGATIFFPIAAFFLIRYGIRLSKRKSEYGK